MDPNNEPDVEVKILGKTVSLRPVLAEMKELQRRVGGLMALMKRMGAHEVTIEDLAAIIHHGCGKAVGIVEAEEAVFEEGMVNFVGPCANFVKRALADGPRRPKAEATPKA